MLVAIGELGSIRMTPLELEVMSLACGEGRRLSRLQ
jgi:hypothetical protein